MVTEEEEIGGVGNWSRAELKIKSLPPDSKILYARTSCTGTDYTVTWDAGVVQN